MRRTLSSVGSMLSHPCVSTCQDIHIIEPGDQYSVEVLPFKAKYLMCETKDKAAPLFVKIIRDEQFQTCEVQDLECYWSIEEKYPGFGKHDGFQCGRKILIE